MKTGQVYKLVCTDVTVKELYVGSTESLRNRRRVHKTACNTPHNHNYNMIVYQYIRAHGGFENWDFVVLETIEFKEKHELHARERYWIETLESSLNAQVPTQTKKEYYEANKEAIAAQQKEYYVDNADAIKERVKSYQANNSEKVREWKAKHALTDGSKQKQAARYQANSQAIKAKQAELITCQCGLAHTRGHSSRHIKSATHIAALAAKQISSLHISEPNGEQVEGKTDVQQAPSPTDL